MAVFLAESSGNSAKLLKAQPFVQMSRVEIGRDYGVELQNAKTDFVSLLYAIEHQLFPDVSPSETRIDCVARIEDVAAPADVVWVENVETENVAAVRV